MPSYNLFNLGARYTPGGEQGRVTFRIYADNITNKRYWSDTGASYGDTFVWLGAPPPCASPPTTRFKSSLQPDDRTETTMSSNAKAHGMDGTLVAPDWPPLTLAELRALLGPIPCCSASHRILSVSPRPFSAAGVVATRNGSSLHQAPSPRRARSRGIA